MTAEASMSTSMRQELEQRRPHTSQPQGGGGRPGLAPRPPHSYSRPTTSGFDTGPGLDSSRISGNSQPLSRPATSDYHGVGVSGNPYRQRRGNPFAQRRPATSDGGGGSGTPQRRLAASDGSRDAVNSQRRPATSDGGPSTAALHRRPATSGGSASEFPRPGGHGMTGGDLRPGEHEHLLEVTEEAGGVLRTSTRPTSSRQAKPSRLYVHSP